MADCRQHADASPTERTIALLTKAGQIVVPCEAWRPVGGPCWMCKRQRHYRSDLMGFADLLALPSLIAIQTSDGSHHAARLKKILTLCQQNAWFWLSGGGRIQVITWYEYAQPVNGKHWRHKTTEITPLMLLDAGWVPPEFQPNLIDLPITDVTDETM